MLLYRDRTQVRVGDNILHSTAAAVVEVIIEGDEIAHWDLEEPGFMVLCEECGRVLINPGSADWEDVAFIRRGT